MNKVYFSNTSPLVFFANDSCEAIRKYLGFAYSCVSDLHSDRITNGFAWPQLITSQEFVDKKDKHQFLEN